jgi:antitoxin HicB
MMDVVYPVNLSPQDDGSLLVSFPDVPEALSEGGTRAEALDEAADALIAALGGYIHEGREIPPPSAPGPDQPTIVLPSLTAAKVALYRTMRQAGLTPQTLAHRLGMAEQPTRRMLDLDSRSRIETIEEALSVLGKRLVVEIRDAA